MNARRVELHIEELVLHGFHPSDRYRIAAALESELGRLVTEGGAEALKAGDRSTLDAGAFSLRTGTHSADVGRQAARALMGGLAK